ncbi:hypothetical protein Mapa_005818 [Marchantia paleacea]|nr:hypothetical protein Mapa_005818 [Marchantia paleacea]
MLLRNMLLLPLLRETRISTGFCVLQDLPLRISRLSGGKARTKTNERLKGLYITIQRLPVHSVLVSKYSISITNDINVKVVINLPRSPVTW